MWHKDSHFIGDGKALMNILHSDTAKCSLLLSVRDTLTGRHAWWSGHLTTLWPTVRQQETHCHEAVKHLTLYKRTTRKATCSPLQNKPLCAFSIKLTTFFTNRDASFAKTAYLCTQENMKETTDKKIKKLCE